LAESAANTVAQTVRAVSASTVPGDTIVMDSVVGCYAYGNMF